jgi:hypothetical protein
MLVAVFSTRQTPKRLRLALLLQSARFVDRLFCIYVISLRHDDVIRM